GVPFTALDVPFTAQSVPFAARGVPFTAGPVSPAGAALVWSEAPPPPGHPPASPPPTRFLPDRPRQAPNAVRPPAPWHPQRYPAISWYPPVPAGACGRRAATSAPPAVERPGPNPAPHDHGHPPTGDRPPGRGIRGAPAPPR